MTEQNSADEFISYAQNFEDVMLWRALKHVDGGFYVDVGANDPELDSVTKSFYERGWRGINIEPSADYFARLEKYRPLDINLACAAGPSDGIVKFVDVETRGWSTTDEEIGRHYCDQGKGKAYEVQQLCLDTILDRHHSGPIHFLKIDVEGAESAVIAGLDLRKFRPWILVVEALEPITQQPTYGQWEPALFECGYRFVYFDGLNRYYLAEEHEELAEAFRAPPNVLDAFVPAAVVDSRRQAAEAEARLIELQTRLSFCSWRTTRRRLREARSALMEFVRGYQGLPKVARSRISLSLRRGVWSTAAYVGRHPRLREMARSTLARMPALQYRVRRLLQKRPSLGNEVVAVSDVVDVTFGYSSDVLDELVLPLPVGERTLYIFVDHTVLCNANSGVQRVTRGLAAGFVRRGENVRYVKWHAASSQCVLINLVEREHLARWNGPSVTDEERTIYTPPGDPLIPVDARPAEENHWLIVPEVPHITYQEQPVTLDLLLWARRTGLKSGFVFYDAIPLRRDEFDEMSSEHRRYMQELLLADMVWPISDWSATDLLAYWVANEGADAASLPAIQTISLPGESLLSERASSSEEGDDLILSVGTIEPRKNQVLLIHAFEAYRKLHPRSPWRLTLIGNLHPAVEEEVTRAARADTAIQHLGHVSDEELDGLYRRCAFTAFPSVEEGFGLPILEGLWYGKPCLCANFGAMAEVAKGGGCFTVDTRDESTVTQALSRLIEDKELRHTLAAQALSRPIATWDEYAGLISHRVDHDGDHISQIGKVYYWIDATLQFPKNTGIQRVSRQLARALMELGVPLTPVKWIPKQKKFGPVSDTELAFFAQWNGPAPDMWREWAVPDSQQTGNWLFMPDLPLNRSAVEREQLLEYAREVGLLCAAVFYDAIPWKMRSIYPSHFAQAHKDYMIGLGAYDLVLPISAFSRDDLINFLGAWLVKPQGLDARIKATPLPGEFPESPRATQIASRAAGPVTLLCVGTVEPRKNHETLLEAFALAAQRSGTDMKLVIAGGSHSIEPALADRVEAFVANHPDVSWEDDADDARLRDLHLACDFTVYPSVEEGFGLPILESLWYAKPCVCADFGAMLEVAQGGGCLTVDTRSSEELASAIQRLAEDPELRERLAGEATARPFKSWQDYAREVVARLAHAMPAPRPQPLQIAQDEIDRRCCQMRITPRPTLSICISTYNRAEWLAVSLKNWAQLWPDAQPEVELLVCDNASTDHTPDVVKPYLSRSDFSYHRNLSNVGMLGNLRETAHRARGKYIWILGDDDLLLPGAIERVLTSLDSHPGVALAYLNYAFTRIEDARTVVDFDAFYREATPIVPAEPDLDGPIRTLCARNENFFTAIYTLVFRRDHAIKAYSQDTSGRPFSSMLTCIPTTNYVLNNMMNEKGVWIGSPQVVVNMNVSWIKYAPLWILERIPEVYEIAEQRGGAADEIDRWRRHTLPGVAHYFREIFENDPLNNIAYFSPARLVRRFKHLPEFVELRQSLRDVYLRAYNKGHPAAKLPVSCVFPEPIGD